MASILVPEARRARGILDTSVVIELERFDPEQLPIEIAISAITMAELGAGPHSTADPEERPRRQDGLQRAEAAFDPLPFDSEASRAYGRVYSAVVAAGRTARGARAADLLIAATVCSTGLPLYTRNPEDFQALGDLVDVISV
jgi:predicted nucleic acid-binding protein